MRAGVDFDMAVAICSMRSMGCLANPVRHKSELCRCQATGGWRPPTTSTISSSRVSGSWAALCPVCQASLAALDDWAGRLCPAAGLRGAVSPGSQSRREAAGLTQ
jgi:hypothetical protein